MPTVNNTQSIAWDYPIPVVVDGFRIYANEQQVLQVPATELTASISAMNLTPGADYTVHVTAFHAAGESAASNTINFTLVEGPPAAPTNLRLAG